MGHVLADHQKELEEVEEDQRNLENGEHVVDVARQAQPLEGRDFLELEAPAEDIGVHQREEEDDCQAPAGQLAGALRKQRGEGAFEVLVFLDVVEQNLVHDAEEEQEEGDQRVEEEDHVLRLEDPFAVVELDGHQAVQDDHEAQPDWSVHRRCSRRSAFSRPS